MAETAASIGRSLLSSAISLAASAASNEMTLLHGVRNEIWFIKDELETMQAFLRAAEITKEKDELVKVWARQVRDLAYDIQDCLEEFAVYVGSQGLLCQLVKLRHRHRIAVQIRRLKLRVEEVSNRNMSYNLIKSVPSSSMDDPVSHMEMVRYQDAHYVHEEELVGFAGPKKEVLELISSSESDEVQVVWITGGGGLGKTTLAKKVYESSEIIAKFSCRGWITVSQSLNSKEVLKEMIKQLLGPDRLNQLLEDFKGLTVHEHHLADYLNKNLQERRYFLVLDDLWTIQAWDCIKPTVWGDNAKGSRVVVTTRKVNLVEGSNSTSCIYNLKHLEKEDAIKLLLRKTRRSLDDIQKYKMTEIFDKIIKKCGGLPLAIVTIGGLLSTKDVNEWERFYNLLPSESNVMQKIIALSYNDLPSHLKPCFLYLSIFPEDFDIEKKRLVNRWIAEGFVRPMFGKTIDSVAKSYFYELIDRSMILPSKMSMKGNVKSCQVHDIVRDVIVSLSREESYGYLTKGDGSDIADGSFRHVAYHGSKPKKNQHSCGTGGVMVPRGIGNLKELQVLDSVDIRRTSCKAIKELGELTQLRKLEVATAGSAKKKRSILNASIQKLTSLRYLSVSSCVHKDSGGLQWLVSSSYPPPPDLRTLLLIGYIGEMTSWFIDLTKLVKIYLQFSQIQEGKNMEILGALPNFMYLQLSTQSYVSEKLVFISGTFMKLKKLEIVELGQLKEWTIEAGVFSHFKESIGQLEEMRFEDGASPQLESIYIGKCSFASGIIGIKHLPRLKEISLYECEVARIDILREEVNSHPNHPVLDVHQDLGDVDGSVVQVEATSALPDHAGESSQVIALPTSNSEIQPS